MIPEKTIQEIIRRIVDAAQPVKIILFGSYARGNADDRSDLDFMVIEREVPDRHQEMLRLHDVLRSLHIPVDVLVVSEDSFNYWADTPNTVYFEANEQGLVCYEEAPRASARATA